MYNETTGGRPWRQDGVHKARRGQGAQAFVVRRGLDGVPDTASLELASSPGVWLTAFSWPDAHEGCAGWANRWFCAVKPRGQELNYMKATPGTPALHPALHFQHYYRLLPGFGDGTDTENPA